MKPSRYTIAVQTKTGFGLVNLLSRTAMELDAQAYETFNEILTSPKTYATPSADLVAFISDLKQGLFLLDDDFDEAQHINSIVQEARLEHGDLGLVIAPTMGCNFNCHYCFESKEDISLSDGKERAILDFAASQIGDRESLSVQWFGGEPLEAHDTIVRLSRQFMELAQTHQIPYKSTLISNGYNLNSDLARQLAEVGVQLVQVTFDGARLQHDRVRKTKGGDGSFERIIENIKAAGEHMDISIRVHVAPYNASSVFELLEELSSADLPLARVSIYFAPLFDYKQDTDRASFRSDERRFLSSEEFAQLQTPLLQRAAVLGFRIGDPLTASWSICTAVRDGSYVIGPRGEITKCYMDAGDQSETLGSVEAGIGDRPRYDEWLDVKIPRDDECAECPVLPICLGGCTKQWRKGADKSVICSPLRYNAQEVFANYFDSH